MKLNHEVTVFLDELQHPFRAEIELLRKYIVSANGDITENIKWNGPNYCFKDDDRITMRIQPPSQQVQLIFHRGAKKQAQPSHKLIEITNKLFAWKENDRAVATFKSKEAIETNKDELIVIINEWIKAAQ